MSRQLPLRPNLDHLRKQAKDLLDAARASHPSWQLADAQHALARGYGFSSWPALKTHVDAMAAADTTAAAADRSQPARPANGDSPLAGSWVANLADSIRHPAAQFQSATLDIRVSGTRVTMAQVVIDEAGQTSGSTMTIDADGRTHTAQGGGAGHVLTAQWLDANTLEAIDAKDGIEMGRGRYEVSPDGRRLTVVGAEHRLVFDRR